jgi:hypothetical protein
MNRKTGMLFFLFILVMLPVNSYGYLDIGTGSYLFQLAIGFFIGSIFAVKMFWKRITGYFSGLFGRHESREEDTADEP